MVQWLCLVGVAAAVASAAKARKQGEAQNHVFADSGRRRLWVGHTVAEVEGGDMVWGSSGGSWGEEDEQAAEITVPAVREVSGSAGGEGAAGIVHADGGGAGVTAIEGDNVAEGEDTSVAWNPDASLGGITSDTTSDVGQSSANDALSDAVETVEVAPAPVDAADDADDQVGNTPSTTMDTGTLTSSAPDDESLIPEEQIEDPVASTTSSVKDPAARSDQLNNEPSTDQRTGAEQIVETPAPSDALTSLVSATSNLDILQSEVTPQSVGMDASAEPATSEPSAVLSLIETPSADGQTTNEVSADTPAPSATTLLGLESVTTTPIATDPEENSAAIDGSKTGSQGNNDATAKSDVIAVEQPASDQAAAAAPTATTDDHPTQDSTVPNDMAVEPGSDIIDEEKPTLDTVIPAPLATMDDHQTQDSSVSDNVATDPPKSTNTDNVGSPVSVIDPPTDTEPSSDDITTEQSTSDLVTPGPSSTDAPTIQDSSTPEIIPDEPAEEETSANDLSSSSTVEKTDTPAAAGTPISETESSPSLVDAIHDTTDPPQVVDSLVSPVTLDSESLTPSTDTGDEPTSSGSSSRAQNLASDSELLPPSKVVLGTDDVVLATMEFTRDDPASPIKEDLSSVIEDIPADAVATIPGEETTQGDTIELPASTDAPHTTDADIPFVIAEEPVVVAEAGARVDADSLIISAATANDGNDMTTDTLITDNDGVSEEGEGVTEDSTGHAKKEEDEYSDNNAGGADGLADDNVAGVTSNGATLASDADGTSEPASGAVEPGDMSSTEASSPATVTNDLASTGDAEVTESHGVGADGTSEEVEADSNGTLVTISSQIVEAAADEDAAALKVASASENVALSIVEAPSGSSERASFDLRAQVSAAVTPSASSGDEASRLSTKVDESEGALSTDNSTTVVSTRTMTLTSSDVGTSDTSTSAKPASSTITSTSSVVLDSKSEESKTNVTTELLTVDTVSTSTNLAAETPTEAKLTGSGALLLTDGATAEAYVRGKTSIDSGVVATDNEEEALLAGIPGAANNGDVHIIGGRKSRVGSAGSGLYGSSSTSQNVVRYTACAVSVLSVALLVGFHFVNSDNRLHWPTHSPGTYWSPNTWEFVVYTGYLQQTMALSPMTLMQTPYFLWEFTDIFAWSSLLVYKSPSSPLSEGRRLDIIILNSLVGYADRIGTNEASLIISVDAGFGVVLGAVLSLTVVLYAVDKWRSSSSMSNDASQKPPASLARRLLGLCVLLWFFSLFPLTLVGSFEVTMEVQAKLYSPGSLMLAILAIIVISAGGLAVAARSVFHASSSDLRRPKTRALWGALYEDHKHSARLFFVFTAALQITTGLVIGTVRNSKTLLVLLLVVHGTYLIALFVCAPFTARAALAQRFAYAATAAKLLNVFMAFAFLETIPVSVDARCRVARAFIAMNALILIAWFLRHLVLFCTCVVVMSSRDEDNQLERTDIVRLESGGAQLIHVSFGRPSLAANGPSGSQTTPNQCEWQGSATPSAAIL
jgi:hypothetical protein